MNHLDHVRELLDTLNEWFAQRANGEPTTNSEQAMWEQVHYQLTALDAAVPQRPPEQRRYGAVWPRKQ